MITQKTISEIRNNINTGVEYEIALFRCLLLDESEIRHVDVAIRTRDDARKIDSIMHSTNIRLIKNELQRHLLSLTDVSFETQNDDVGPSDIVMFVKNASGSTERIGISVKYANTCTLNATGRKFLTEAQILDLKRKLVDFTDEYILEMTQKFGRVDAWFHRKKPSITTDRYIDIIRDEVIANWLCKSEDDKRNILMEAYQETSPIEYWVYTYTAKSQILDTHPYKIAPSDVSLVELKKYQTSYVGFYLHDRLIGKMQVKFNNGFVEKCKKVHPDKIVDGVKMSFGRPFTSWNFCLV